MQYESLQAQYQLPSLDSLNVFFEITLEDSKHPLRVIRRKMCERVEQFLSVLEGLFHTDGTTVSSMHEIEHLSRQDHNRALRVYRKLMYYLRYGQQVGVSLSEQQEAKYIKEIYAEWSMVVEDVGYLLEKMKSAWTTSTIKEEEVAYLG